MRGAKSTLAPERKGTRRRIAEAGAVGGLRRHRPREQAAKKKSAANRIHPTTASLTQREYAPGVAQVELQRPGLAHQDHRTVSGNGRFLAGGQ